MRTTYSMFKRQLVIASIGVTGAFACSSAFAGPEGADPSAADEWHALMITSGAGQQLRIPRGYFP